MIKRKKAAKEAGKILNNKLKTTLFQRRRTRAIMMEVNYE